MIKNDQPLNLKASSKIEGDDLDDEWKDPLDQPGVLSLAKVHASAQRPHHDYDNINPETMEDVKFCPCCNLPEETKGIITPFSFCSDIRDFSACGIGTFLYFYFMRYTIICLFVAFSMASLPTILISKSYSTQLITYCKAYYVNTSDIIPYGDLYTNSTNCLRYLVQNDTNTTITNQTDWVLQMNSDNIKYYRAVLTEKSPQNYDEYIADYNFLNFLTLITLFIMNIMFISIIRGLSYEADFMNDTPADYTLMISGISNWFQSKQEIIKNTLEIREDALFDLNLCYKINNFFELKNKNLAAKRALRTCRQNKTSVYITGTCCCCQTMQTVDQLKGIVGSTSARLQELTIALKEHPATLFGGVVFATFNTMAEYKNYYSLFPHSALSWMGRQLEYFFAVVFCPCCYTEKQKSHMKKMESLKVELAPEPQDVLWENMEFTSTQRFFKSLWVFTVSLVCMTASLGIIFGLNVVQFSAEKKGWSTNAYVKYSISIAISIILSIINMIMTSVLQELTNHEKCRTMTSYYLSFSLKLTIFTFFNSAIIPLFSNYLQGEWGNNTILLNNMLIIFLSNAFVSPFLWLANIPLLIKLFFRRRLESSLKGVENNPIKSKTQKELNELYENPAMDISLKYSHIAKIIMMALFYIPIFPLGVVISGLGIIFAYIVELINFIYFYKRPEMLNADLCAFYFNHFILVLFIYSIGNWLFLADIYTFKSWGLVNIILFGILCVIPYHDFLFVNCTGLSETTGNPHENYLSNYFKFSYDYERHNPITRLEGLQKYFKRLLEHKRMTQEEYDMTVKNLKNVNVLEIYYRTNQNMRQTHSMQRKAKVKAKTKKIQSLQASKKIADDQMNFLSRCEPNFQVSVYANIYNLGLEDCFFGGDNFGYTYQGGQNVQQYTYVENKIQQQGFVSQRQENDNPTQHYEQQGYQNVPNVSNRQEIEMGNMYIPSFPDVPGENAGIQMYPNMNQGNMGMQMQQQETMGQQMYPNLNQANMGMQMQQQENMGQQMYPNLNQANMGMQIHQQGNPGQQMFGNVNPDDIKLNVQPFGSLK